MTIERYIKKRDGGWSLEEIQNEHSLSEGTVYTLELGYQCYLRKLSLVDAIDIIRRVN